MTKKNETNKGKKGRAQKLDTLKKADGKEEKKKPRAKLDSLTQAHGKDERQKVAIARAQELEELLGIKEVNPFGTTIISDFEEKIQSLPIVDLQALAVKTGVFPNGTQRSLKGKLIRAFQEYNKSSMVIPSPQPIGIKNQDTDAYKEARRLMQEGL